MQSYRTRIHGQVIELRRGDWGGEQVLLNGRQVSEHSAFNAKPHFFDLQDEDGKTHHIEMRLYDQSKWGIGKFRVVVNVNGEERCRLDAINPDDLTVTCRNCGYALAGLPIESGEVRCPECGKHTPEELLDLPGLGSGARPDEGDPA